MQLLFIDYTDLVIKAYKEKLETNQLSQLLIHPTAANIRQECLNVYNERTRRAEQVEENTLRAFFGVPPAGKNLGYVIERYNADKFRPLQSLIKGEIKNPAVITVELLAWLIDFTPRPLGNAQKVLGNQKETDGGVGSKAGNESHSEMELTKTNMAGINNALPEEYDESIGNLTQAEGSKAPLIGKEYAVNLPAKNLEKYSKGKRRKIIAVIAFIVAILFGGIYFTWQHESSGNIAFGNTNNGCMYWASDHYEQVPCNEPTEGRLILALNEEKIKRFKRITLVDTITESSINKVYYISVDGKLEFYTSGGNHPVYVTRVLKKLSAYMFDKHLRKKEDPSVTEIPLSNK